MAEATFPAAQHLAQFNLQQKPSINSKYLLTIKARTSPFLTLILASIVSEDPVRSWPWSYCSRRLLSTHRAAKHDPSDEAEPDVRHAVCFGTEDLSSTLHIISGLLHVSFINNKNTGNQSEVATLSFYSPVTHSSGSPRCNLWSGFYSKSRKSI